MSPDAMVPLIASAAVLAVMLFLWRQKKRPHGDPPRPPRPARQKEAEQRYDNVVITNLQDGTMIKGHDAVEAYFKKEKEILDEHGSSIIFQVYRINMRAKTLEELQSEKLAEIKVDSGFVSGGDTVAAVKKKVRPLLEGKSGSGPEAGAQPGLTIEEAERITLFFGSSPMQDEKLFYADHFMMLPVWVQVYLHGGDFEEVRALADKLRGEKRGEPPP